MSAQKRSLERLVRASVLCSCAHSQPSARQGSVVYGGHVLMKNKHWCQRSYFSFISNKAQSDESQLKQETIVSESNDITPFQSTVVPFDQYRF